MALAANCVIRPTQRNARIRQAVVLRQASLESEVPSSRVKLEVDPHSANIAGAQADVGFATGAASGVIKPFLTETLCLVVRPFLRCPNLSHAS